MKPFLSDNFLLNTKTAEQLYFEHASKMPIIDYHNHLPPKEIAGGRVFASLTAAWLEGDHYKWRAMRTNGVNEQFVTGDASDWEKFEKWAETVPYTLRNPLYHWSHLELKRYFGISTILNANTAREIYDEANAQLAKISAPGLLEKMNVELVCTTDDPIDSLEYHQQWSQVKNRVKMLPAFRPDKIYAIDIDGYSDYLQKLEVAVGSSINTFDDLLAAAQDRIDFFHKNGASVSDHGLEQLYDVEYSAKRSEEIFKKYKEGKAITEEEVQIFKMTTLLELSKMYHANGWVQQFHLGAIRNNSARMMRELGPDTGFDSIGDFSQVRALSKFLGELDSHDQLTKTILYNLNPRDNEAFATMIGNFNDGSVAGKIQWGSAWWFLDQKDGMEKQLNALSNMGLLSRFVGMLTDSRSFLSFPRHEYFRRILCNLIGQDVENGELPADMDLLGKLVEDISYYNNKNYFGF